MNRSRIDLDKINRKMSDKEDDQEISSLGTKEYWESAYEKDLENFEDTDDSGEIWFGRACQDRMIKYLSTGQDIDREKCRILDLGCGNGAMSLALRRIGFKAITGIDYAPSAIKLARTVAQKEGFDDVRFEVCDLLADQSTSNNLDGNFDILLDKGTYDAIGLMQNGGEARKSYKSSVVRFFSPSKDSHRLLLIASCNSTKEELLNVFKPEFESLDELLAPTTMTFGGRTGSTVTTIILKLL